LSLGDNNDRLDIFVKDQQTGELILASSNSHGVIANGESKYPTMSANGRFIAFQSSASNLVAGDTNGVEDVFVKDLLTGETTLVSVGLNGLAGAGGFSLKPRLSADGRFVFFHSRADNLVEGDNNGTIDVFARDMATGQTYLLSVGENGEQGNGRSLRSNASDDGSVVIFESLASNLVAGDTNGAADLFSVKIAWEELSLLGDGGDDVLTGTPYGEYINAGYGDDQVSAGWGNDTIYATGGHDWVRGEEGDDRLHGGWGNDTLYGGTGNDTLLGLADSDSLIGGGGGDLFRFNQTTTPDAPDVVADFQDAGDAAGDLIDLEVIDADLTAAKDQAFQAPMLANAFTSIGQLILIQSGDDTIIRGNTDADLSTAEIEIILQGVQADHISAADFML
jgi:Ca2+-binding RTX toxin-like protein